MTINPNRPLKEFTFTTEIKADNIDEIIEDCFESYYECDDDFTRAGMWSDIEFLKVLQKGLK
jgi:hypothetical protein